MRIGKTNISRAIENRETSNGSKIGLMEMTFLVPLRIDSNERRENVEALIKYTFSHFKTSLIVLEADAIRKFFSECHADGFQYMFIEDSNEIFHRTKWINKLILASQTPYVSVWDADAIAPFEQILEAFEKLRYNGYAMSFPYDGRFYSCDRISGDLFKNKLDIKILVRHIPIMRLMHGYHSVGGAFLVNKEFYLYAGGENENFYGWGPEDAERVKRLEIFNMSIYFTPGELFHLWHPVGKNSCFANHEVERKNRLELLNTCKRVYYG